MTHIIRKTKTFQQTTIWNTVDSHYPKHEQLKLMLNTFKLKKQQNWFLFVCVAVLWPSQTNGVMSSMVTLPNQEQTTALLVSAEGRERQ